MNYYQMDIEEVLKKVDSKISGLNKNEIKGKQIRFGKNKIESKTKELNIIKFFKEFNDLMIIILLISAVISFIISTINNEFFIDSIIIITIVIVNAILGFIQELKADKAIESLKDLQVSKVKVKRDNEVKIVNSEDIVIGDILVLDSGDKIPADCRIISQTSLKVDESSLTGESNSISKNENKIDKVVPLSERKNMIYSGTLVVYGKCTAVVVETGMNTEIGQIAKSLDKQENEITPLQKRIDGISKVLSLIIIIIISIMFLIGSLKGIKISEIIMLSISLAVAAIPEGLPAVITIVLSVGMSSMAKGKAIVRKMSSVETLGCTEIIASDKTGTITQNKMTIREVYFDNNIINTIKEENILIDIMSLNNDVLKNKNEYIGDPTEVAIYNYCEKIVDIMKIRNKYKRIDEIPFDSDRKMMSVINKFDKDIRLLTKGSFDSIIDRCNKIYINGNIENLTKDIKNKLKNIETKESNKAYRVLAYAYKVLDNSYSLDDNLENELIFVGMTAMIDPPRDDVKESINLCKKAHIRPIMITGDSLSTAKTIAKEVGILENEKEAITGIELDSLTNKQLIKEVSKYSVYARVSPTNKLQIVNALKENNKVVAMTGDGVNDAPALKSANIGVGMGITGTEVSKNVSDIILSDDSFSTIVSAVKEGRKIFDNIRNVLVYLITGNIAEVLIVFIFMLFGLEIFLPIQLLYINLITDSLPAIALAFEKEADDVMSRKIRKKDSSFFTPFLISKMIISSILKTITIIIVYFVSIKFYDIQTANTMSFLSLILLEMIFAFTCRNLKKNIIGKGFFSNRYLNKSMILLCLIQIIIFVTPIRRAFQLSSLNLLQVSYCFMIVIIVFLIDELTKKAINRLFKD